MVEENKKKGESPEESAGLDDQSAETMMSEGLNPLSEDDDLEAQMAAAMAAESLAASSDDDLAAQMAAAMDAENSKLTEDEDDVSAQMAAALMDESVVDSDVLKVLSEKGDKLEGTPVRDAKFQQLAPSDEMVGKDNIDRLLDVQLNVAVELGRKEMKIKDILGLGPGKIIELNKLAGEPVDLLVNGKLLAKGEVVVVDENFGVRITELIDPVDRIKMLR